MIIEMKPISMAEAKGYIDKDKEIAGFINKLVKLNEKEAEKLKEEINKLDSIKIKEEHISKIIDLLPEDNQDINKIFNDTNLEENEATKILEIVKKYK